MATQGMLSVVRNGEVILKAVCGCNGSNVEKLKKSLEEGPILDPTLVHEKCLENSFGCPECLVVMSHNRIASETGDEIGGLYTEKFNDPKFNPRWDRGTVDNLCIWEVG